MTAKIDVNWQAFTAEVNTALNNASRLTRLPLSGDRWEEILVAVFERLGHAVRWRPGSHSPGADIQLYQTGLADTEISVKAGSLKRLEKTVKVLTFSSYRLTRHTSLEAKKHFIDEDAAKIDWYLFAAREDTKTVRNYHVYLTRATIVNAEGASWTETTSGWVGVQDNGVRMRIVKNMSDQLWGDIPLSLIDHRPEELNGNVLGARIATVTIPVEQLGSRIDLLFSQILDQL